MNSLKALLFDLDGTLLNSKNSVIDAVFYIANKYAPEKFTYDELEERFGESLDDFISLLNVEEEKEVFDSYEEHLMKHHDQFVSLFPRVREAMLDLKERGLQLAIVTNKQRLLTIQGLSLFDIHQLFYPIVTIDDVKQGKPNGEPILQAIDALQVEKDEVLMIGDTRFDVLAARDAGVQVAVIDWYQDFQRKEVINPDYYYLSIEEMMMDLFQPEKMKGDIVNG